MTVMGLFAVPLYRSKIQPLDPITLTKLFNFEYEKSSYDSDIITHKETKERFLLNRPEFSGLKKSLQVLVDEYAYQVLGTDSTLSWEITTSWVNKSEPGGYHSPHVHSNSLISGVLYLKTDPISGSICFYKDSSHKTIFTNTINVDFEKITDWNTEAIAINPADFEVLLFPSTLSHSVLSNKSNTDRYSLAFNVFPRGKIAKGSNSELTV
jgi:uncharacterized protein (TIGR02466 family)